MMVMNGEETTQIFNTIVGVRQGGVVSPKLFNIYIEDIIELINKSSEPGIDIGSMKFIFFYDTCKQ